MAKTKKIKPTKNSGYTEDTSPEALTIRQPDDSAPSRDTHKFLQYPDGGQMPIWYRHQGKDKEVVFRGHTDQAQEEIIVTLPSKSGTLAVYGEGGTIDLTDYATVAYSNEEDAKIRNEVAKNNYTKTEIDELISDIDFTDDFSDLTTQVNANKNKSESNEKDIGILESKITDIQTEQDEQDKLIEENKQGVSKNKTDTEQNTKDIEELKDGLNSSDDGFFGYEWKNNLDVGDTPNDGLFYASNGVTAVDEVKLTTKLHLSTIDQDDTTHHLESFEKGDVIECYSDGTNPAQGFFQVESVEEREVGYVIIDVVVIRSSGNWSDAVDPSGQNGHWKFNYQIGLEVEAGNYYSKTESDNLFASLTQNNTLKGTQTIKKEVVISATVPQRFVTFKNRYATNSDGSDAGAGGTGFGINFDLDHGNSGYNQVKWTNRSGDILNINGGTGAGAKYNGAITDDKHIANKKYVDDSIEGVPLPDLSDYMTEEETVEFVDSMDKLNLVMANTNARTYDQALKTELIEYVDDKVDSGGGGVMLHSTEFLNYLMFVLLHLMVQMLMVSVGQGIKIQFSILKTLVVF